MPKLNHDEMIRSLTTTVNHMMRIEKAVADKDPGYEEVDPPLPMMRQQTIDVMIGLLSYIKNQLEPAPTEFLNHTLSLSEGEQAYRLAQLFAKE